MGQIVCGGNSETVNSIGPALAAKQSVSAGNGTTGKTPSEPHTCDKEHPKSTEEKPVSGSECVHTFSTSYVCCYFYDNFLYVISDLDGTRL